MRRRFIIRLGDNKVKNNVIYYTSSDGSIVVPYLFNFGANLTTNNYTDNGQMTFDAVVFYIGDYAFYNCTSLTSIEIPNSVTSIGNYAFSGCTSLTSIEIPNSVISINQKTFSQCIRLKRIVIGSNVTSIGYYAFDGCTSLTSIEIPNSVTSIGNYAFSGCSGLTSIEIPNSVTSIGSGVFSGCSGLTSIIVSVGNSIYDSRNNCNAIIETTSNILIAGCKNTIIPNSVTSIGSYAFSGCSGLTSIEIPNSVTSIGSYAFSGCSGLTSIEIPNSVTSIRQNAFSDCSNLSSIYIKSTTPPTLGFNAFYRNASKRKIYVPRASLNAYKTASDWSAYADAIEPYGF